MLTPSFRARIVLGSVLSVFAVVLPLFLLDIKAEREKQRQRLFSHAELSVELLRQSVSLPLWDFNYAFLKELFVGLETDPLIISGTLRDSRGSVVAAYRRDTALAASDLDLTIDRAIEAKSAGGTETLGTIALQFSGAVANADLVDYARNKLLTLALLIMLVALVLFVVLGRIVAPLQHLIAAIGAIRQGELDKLVPGTGRPDEIGAVAAALDQLRLAESEMQVLRAERDAETNRERHRMVRALESTDDGVILLDERRRLAMQNKRAQIYFGELRKGAPVDPAQLIALPDRLAGDRIDGSVDTVVRKSHSDREFELRVRVDPILDEEGAALGHVFLASDITEQLRQKRRADYLALHDSLTGLPNRRALEAELANDKDIPAGLMLGDLDRFKVINDSMGHPVGDALLREVANLLRESVGDAGMAFRLGGDEFAVIIRASNCRDQLAFFADTLIERLSAPLIVDGRPLQTGISLGIATCPDDTKSMGQLIQFADLALYDAKKGGRGRLSTFRPDLRRDVQRRQFLETALVEVLATGEGPRPKFQVQTDAASRQIVGYEALARWSIPTEGAVSPREFIPVAEEAGIIADLTSEIMRQSCALARDIGARGFDGRVAVNFSPSLFGGQALALVRDSLAHTGCAPPLAEIEITEQVLLSDRDGVREEIEAIRALGVTVALDDFGMGYSSLSYLQRFPVDKIKIDRAFVSEICRSRETRAIIQAIAELGNALGMQVTGEGAETEDERILLSRCGVDIIQGWVDGRPTDADEVRRKFGASAAAGTGVHAASL